MSTTHIGPSQSEKSLFAVWDLVDHVRLARGERAAAAVAERALAAAREAETSQRSTPLRATVSRLPKKV